jgi:uncharacterized protein (DUF58 family)
VQSLTLRQRFSPGRFLRGSGVEPGPVVLDRSRVYILPTLTGMVFAGMLALMLFGSINYNNSMGHLFTFLVASMALVSILHTYRNLAGLAFSPGWTRPAFAGQRAGYELLIDNPAALRRPGIQLELAGESPVVTGLDNGKTHRVMLWRNTTHRGVLPMGRCKVSTRYPLGLFRAWAFVELPLECSVYPHPGPARVPPQSPVYKPQQSGDKGRGVDDFVGFRPWRPGDSPRHVFWKAAARDRTLLVKQFGGDRADEAWLDWAALPGLGTEARLSQLCRWVVDAGRNHQPFGLRLPGCEIAIGSGATHQQRCLEALARFA